MASRVAREFKLGGPCFTVSGGSASGIKTIETAMHSLSANETDTFVCGCVDLAGDFRQFALNAAVNTPRDPASACCLPAEGAAAVVLKRLDTAQKDGDKIYGVITGIAGTSGDGIPGDEQFDPIQTKKRYKASLKSVLKMSQNTASDIRLYETALSGRTEKVNVQSNHLTRLMQQSHGQAGYHMTSAMSAIGYTGCASALISIIKTALCLYHQKLPANTQLLKNLSIKKEPLFQE